MKVIVFSDSFQTLSGGICSYNSKTGLFGGYSPKSPSIAPNNVNMSFFSFDKWTFSTFPIGNQGLGQPLTTINSNPNLIQAVYSLNVDGQASPNPLAGSGFNWNTSIDTYFKVTFSLSSSSSYDFRVGLNDTQGQGGYYRIYFGTSGPLIAGCAIGGTGYNMNLSADGSIHNIRLEVRTSEGINGHLYMYLDNTLMYSNLYAISSFPYGKAATNTTLSYYSNSPIGLFKIYNVEFGYSNYPLPRVNLNWNRQPKTLLNNYLFPIVKD